MTAPELLDAIEALTERMAGIREPEGFDVRSSNPAEVRFAAIDYRAAYREQRDVLDDVCDLLARVRDALPDTDTDDKEPA